MPPGGKPPARRGGRSGFVPTLSGHQDFIPSSERTQDNLDTLHRGLILPQATYKYTRIAPNEIRLLHILPADNKRDMIYTELRTVKLDKEPFPRYHALSYTWGNEEPTEKVWIRKPESWPARPRPHIKPVDILFNRGWEIVKENHRLKPNATFYVRPNLGDALRHLRNYPQDQSQNEPETLILWVDCICINQNDEDEKSTQVSKMADIYKHAEGVWIWLGKANEDSSIGMDFVSRIPGLERDTGFSVKGSSAQQWSAFIALMRREWFRRRWVVQELAFAKEAFLLCGDDTVHWIDYCSAVEFYRHRSDTIAALYDDSPEVRQQLTVLGDLQASGAGKMISVTNAYVRGATARLKTLEQLVSELTMFEAGDPRDAVYALMTLASDVQDGSQQQGPMMWHHDASRVTLKTDYKKNILEVFKDFVAFCIIRSSQLDIICRKWAPNRKIKRLTVKERVKYRGQKAPTEGVLLPSWVGLLKESAFGMPRSGPSSRIAGNSLVDAERPYHACGRSVAKILFGEIDVEGNEGQASLNLRDRDLLAHPSTYKVEAEDTLAVSPGRVSDGTIYVRGFRIRIIEQISHRLYEGMIPREWLALGLWTEGSGTGASNDIPEKFWRTLVADRTSDGREAPVAYSEALSWAIERQSVNGDIHTAELIRRGKPPFMVEFLKRVQEVIWDKRFFTLANADELSYHLGIAPSRTEVGDLIVILLGCRVPVVLSPVNKDDHRCGFRLVGEAYLHGMMNGEVLGLAEYANYYSRDPAEISEEFCLL